MRQIQYQLHTLLSQQTVDLINFNGTVPIIHVQDPSFYRSCETREATIIIAICKYHISLNRSPGVSLFFPEVFQQASICERLWEQGPHGSGHQFPFYQLTYISFFCAFQCILKHEKLIILTQVMTTLIFGIMYKVQWRSKL